MLSDMRVVFDYSSRAMSGMLPYRDYTIEYPPLAVPLFLVPRLFTNRFNIYVVLFAGEMLIFDAIILYLVCLWTEARAGTYRIPAVVGWYTLFLASLYPLLATRFDLAPTAVAFAAAIWWFTIRPALGGALTALGTMIKIFPSLVAGPALVWEIVHVRTTKLRGNLTCLALVGCAIAGWWTIGGLDRTLQFQVERGLHVETLWAGLIMVIDSVRNSPLSIENYHNAGMLLGKGTDRVLHLVFPVQAAAVLLVMWRFWRTGADDPLRYTGAAILAFIITGVALSPQYLMWPIPFIAISEGRASSLLRWLFFLSLVITTLIFPLTYGSLLHFEFWAVGLLNLRNALLLLILILWMLAPGSDLTIGQGQRARPTAANADSGDGCIHAGYCRRSSAAGGRHIGLVAD